MSTCEPGMNAGTPTSTISPPLVRSITRPDTSSCSRMACSSVSQMRRRLAFEYDSRT